MDIVLRYLREGVVYMWPVFSIFLSYLLPPPLGQTSVLNCYIRPTPWRDILTFGIKSISCILL